MGERPAPKAAVDLETVTDMEGRGYVGLVAGTGAAYQAHEILSWTLQVQASER